MNDSEPVLSYTRVPALVEVIGKVVSRDSLHYPFLYVHGVGWRVLDLSLDVFNESLK